MVLSVIFLWRKVKPFAKRLNTFEYLAEISEGFFWIFCFKVVKIILHIPRKCVI